MGPLPWRARPGAWRPAPPDWPPDHTLQNNAAHPCCPQAVLQLTCMVVGRLLVPLSGIRCCGCCQVVVDNHDHDTWRALPPHGHGTNTAKASWHEFKGARTGSKQMQAGRSRQAGRQAPRHNAIHRQTGARCGRQGRRRLKGDHCANMKGGTGAQGPKRGALAPGRTSKTAVGGAAVPGSSTHDRAPRGGGGGRGRARKRPHPHRHTAAVG